MPRIEAAMLSGVHVGGPEIEAPRAKSQLMLAPSMR
jgi:hypothetical protein